MALHRPGRALGQLTQEIDREVAHADLTGDQRHLDNPSGAGIVNILKYAFNLAPNLGDLDRPTFAS